MVLPTIDDFLEGREVDDAAYRRILHMHSGTAHKRALPVGPIDLPFSA
jgi:NAD+ synthase